MVEEPRRPGGGGCKKYDSLPVDFLRGGGEAHHNFFYNFWPSPERLFY